MKKLEIEKNKPALIMSVLKIEYLLLLVSSISNLFSNKINANKWIGLGLLMLGRQSNPDFI